MVNKSDLENILFLDIETISLTKDFDDLPERLKSHWQRKSSYIKTDLDYPESYKDRAAIYAEFGKVFCIAIGAIIEKGKKLVVKTLYHSEERELLLEFKSILEKHPSGTKLLLCAHNGKEFDFPYLSRRMLINGIKLPEILNISGKKPWEVNHLDTLEMWKFGDYKNYTSLDLLASVFDIPTSKNQIDGSQVNATFYEKGDVESILKYCAEDVVVLTRLFLKINSLKTIDEENIIRR